MNPAEHEFRMVSGSPDETRGVGRRIGRCLEGRAVVLLEGEMGSGKTVIAKGLYEGVGGPDPNHVVSPSYTVVNLYIDAPRPVYHVDLYRLESDRQLLGLEYEDFLYTHGGLTVVEWPRGVPGLLEADEYLTVRFAPGETPTERVITVLATGDRYASVFRELANAC